MTSSHFRRADPGALRSHRNGTSGVKSARPFYVYYFPGTIVILRAPGMSSPTVPTNDESVAADQPVGIETDLLDPYERLVSIEVLGERVDVPEKNRLLRCFQYLSLKTISYGDFCWNGECTNCQVWYHTEEQTGEVDRPGLACRMEVVEGMVITKLSHFIELDGISK